MMKFNWRALATPKISRPVSSEAELRPTDPAYFTGNSKYYSKLTEMNNLIRQHSIDFKSQPQQTMQWMSKSSMVQDLGFRMSVSMYADFKHRLNLLYPVQEPQVKKFLEQFVPVGKSLEKPPVPVIALDELGRSYTVASRKTAKAQTWIVKGQGQIYVNGVNLCDFFTELSDREKIIKPFELAGSLGKYNVWAIVEGGGRTGQADAIAVACARGIVVHDEATRDTLMSAGLTTIDRRQVERKKTGQPKARKKNTWVKR